MRIAVDWLDDRFSGSATKNEEDDDGAEERHHFRCDILRDGESTEDETGSSLQSVYMMKIGVTRVTALRNRYKCLTLKHFCNQDVQMLT